MLHREFPENTTKETICSYFWSGIVVGVLHFRGSKDWAYSVIESLDSPPIEIIDIAMANDRNAAMDALQVVARSADQQTAGRWLLADISHQLTAGSISTAEAVCAAMRVAIATKLPDNVYYDFDGIDDALRLAMSDVCGTEEEVEEDFFMVLGKHSGAV